MSKKIDMDVECPDCRTKFVSQLYRSIWAEYPENKKLIMEDKINMVECPNCDFSKHVDFPFLCTNVKKKFALWYEPYPDKQIDADTLLYKKKFGADSFYTKAPRISNWDTFKRKIVEFDSSHPNNAATPVISDDMQKNMAGFMAYIEVRNKKGIFERAKNYGSKIINGSDEVTATLSALDNLLKEYHSDNLFFTSATQDVFQKSKQAIRKQKDRVTYSVKEEKRNPTEIVLTTLCNVSCNIVSSGQYHVYRGILTDTGKGYHAFFKRSIDLMGRKGFITKEEADADLNAIRQQIKSAG